MLKLNKRHVTILAILLSLSVVLLSAGCSQTETAESTTTDALTTTTDAITTASDTETKIEEETTATTVKTDDSTSTETAEPTESTNDPQWIFESTDLAGDKVNHSYLAENKVTLVNVWATNCPNCVAEMPDLAQVAKEYADKGVGFLGIVSDIYENEPDEIIVSIAGDIVADSGIEFSNVMASDSIIASILAGIYAVPTTFFTDSEGRIIGELVVGAMSLQQMKDNIEIALAEVD
ncbi:MAG TPA: TlpA family protein disulfide reductase [Clostridiaceae bacterium]|nr:TlpA family protein disulfide reductase [Clostridiaceae bacterium]